MARAPGSLLRRNVLLMVGTVLVGQILAGLFVLNFVMQPQIERVAAVTADMILGLSQAMRTMDPADKDALLTRFEANGDIAIRRSLSHKVPVPRFPNYLERRFIAAMSERLAAREELAWRKGDGNRLWFRLNLGGQDYWISATPPTQRSALASLFYAFAAAFAVAIVAGYWLQRRLDAPLRRLAREVEALDPLRGPEPVDVRGP
ncbi:two-component sensor histidine kinase, partial [Novosphingobium sp. 1949]|nr:two-component sensor histidine kinase [Novosphingobium organovorum]